MENTTVNQQSNYSIVRTYAGFWWRFLAIIIDGIVLSIIGGIFLLPIMGLFGLSLSNMMDFDEMYDKQLPFAIAAAGSIISIGLIYQAITWLYYALFESSKYQATPGKLMLNIKVTDMEGNKISFGRATGRYFGKIISQMIFYIGFIMAGFTSKKQALHDMMAGCLVVKEDRVFKG